MKNFKFIITVLILFSLVNSPAFCPNGDFGAIFSDSFNFTYGTVRTGPKGNVKQVNGQNFDVEDVHRQLCESVANVKKATGPVHNVVVAGLTIFVKVGNVFDAFYQPLVDGMATLAFVSGDVPKGYSKEGYRIIGASPEYQPLRLLRNFGVRVSSPSPLAKSHGSVLKQYYEGWEKAQKEGVVKLQSTLKEDLAADMPHDSVYSLIEKMQKHMEEREREANVSFGSSIDSEQYLLAYLSAKKDKFPNQTNLEFRFKDLLPKYRTEKIRELRKKLAKQLGGSDDVNTMRGHIAAFSSDLNLYEGSSIAGYVFHLHTTNEMCCCCAFSLAEELLHRDWSKRLQREDEDEPFLFVMASASQMIQGSGGRPGIGQENRLAEGDYDTSDGVSDKRVKLNNNQRAIIQKVIKDGEGLKAGDDRKDSKRDSKKDDKKDDKKDNKDDKKDSGKDTKKGDKKSDKKDDRGDRKLTPFVEGSQELRAALNQPLMTAGGKPLYEFLMSGENSKCSLDALGFRNHDHAREFLLARSHDVVTRRLIVPEIRADLAAGEVPSRFIANDQAYKQLNAQATAAQTRLNNELQRLTTILGLQRTASPEELQALQPQQLTTYNTLYEAKKDADQALESHLSSEAVFTGFVGASLRDGRMQSYLVGAGQTTILDALAYNLKVNLTIMGRSNAGTLEIVHEYKLDNSKPTRILLHTNYQDAKGRPVIGGTPGTVGQNDWNHFNLLSSDAVLTLKTVGLAKSGNSGVSDKDKSPPQAAAAPAAAHGAKPIQNSSAVPAR